MEHLSLALLQILELSLTLPSGCFTAHMHRHTSILTANHYPTLLPDRDHQPHPSPHPPGQHSTDTDHSVAVDIEQTTDIGTGIDADTGRIMSDHTHNPSVSPEISPPITSSPSPHQIGVAEHTDVSMLTIVAASAPGLEIYEKNSATYQPVAHVKGALMVNEN